MGKAQKLKEIRKNERIKMMEKKERKMKALRKLSMMFIIFAFLFVGGLFGYKKYLENYLAPLFAKASEIIPGKKGEKNVSENKSYKTGEKQYSQAPDMQIDTKKKYTANFETNKGNFKIELLAEKAPKTVNNFIVLSKDKFYDGLTFHRIIKDFMIQGGDPKGDGTGDPGYKFEDEQNDVQLERGVLAMANSGPNTNGSQFFIITKDKTDWLQGKHTAFGKVTEGLETVMKLESLETGENDKPKEPVVINKVKVEEK